MWCTACRRACNTKIIDDGIGPYEFWGAKYSDKRLIEVSTCCEADLTYDDLEEEDYVDEQILEETKGS
jgi:hypothetical protein